MGAARVIPQAAKLINPEAKIEKVICLIAILLRTKGLRINIAGIVQFRRRRRCQPDVRKETVAY